jgi:hypothetical protein
MPPKYLIVIYIYYIINLLIIKTLNSNVGTGDATLFGKPNSFQITYNKLNLIGGFKMGKQKYFTEEERKEARRKSSEKARRKIGVFPKKLLTKEELLIRKQKRMQEYYLKNKEKIRERAKNYRNKNKEKIKEWFKKKS